MNRNFIFDDIDHALPALLNCILKEGEVVPSRNGGTIEFSHLGITLEKPERRYITNPARKANVAAQVYETMWVLSGRNDIDGLVHYLPRAADYSDDGSTWRGGYGPRLRNFGSSCIDQIKHVVGLLQASPGTRQAVVAIYDADVDTEPGKDIPCNDFLLFTHRNGRLDLQVVIRSNDAMWGWSGINAFEWSTLLELVAHLVGTKVGSLHFSVASWHLYEQHVEKAHKIVQSQTTLLMHTTSPAIALGSRTLDEWDELAERWFLVEERIRKGVATLAEVENFPEPQMRSWLRVLLWWWTGDTMHLSPLEGTQLYDACRVGLQPKKREAQFLAYVSRLHADKHEAYGDSWKRRGQMLGILANIARKVDRIGSGKDTPDETQADTALDLMVYLAKYRLWLAEECMAEYPYDDAHRPEDPQDHLTEVDILLAQIAEQAASAGVTGADAEVAGHVLNELFSEIETSVMVNGKPEIGTVDTMLELAYRLAITLW